MKTFLLRLLRILFKIISILVALGIAVTCVSFPYKPETEASQFVITEEAENSRNETPASVNVEEAESVSDEEPSPGEENLMLLQEETIPEDPDRMPEDYLTSAVILFEDSYSSLLGAETLKEIEALPVAWMDFNEQTAEELGKLLSKPEPVVYLMLNADSFLRLSPKEMTDQLKKCTDGIRESNQDAKIIFTSLMASNEGTYAERNAAKVEESNGILMQFCREHSFNYADLSAQIVDDNGMLLSAYSDNGAAAGTAAETFYENLCDPANYLSAPWEMKSFESKVKVSEVRSLEKLEPSYFDTSVFFGDSVSGTIQYYADSTDEMGNADFVCRTSYSMRAAVDPNVMTLQYAGVVGTPDQILAKLQSERVYIMLGMNDISSLPADQYTTVWTTLLTNLREAKPDADVVFQGCTPIYRGHDGDSLSNPKINIYNDMLRDFAVENGCNYIDVGSFFKDENGDLSADYCRDAYAHLYIDCGVMWADILKDPANYMIDPRI